MNNKSINFPRVKNSVEQSKNIEEDVKYVQQVDKSGSHEAVFYKRLIKMLLSNINVQVIIRLIIFLEDMVILKSI